MKDHMSQEYTSLVEPLSPPAHLRVLLCRRLHAPSREEVQGPDDTPLAGGLRGPKLKVGGHFGQEPGHTVFLEGTRHQSKEPLKRSRQ